MKERLLTQQLREFIDNDQHYSVGLVSGIRKTGKTTILKQLQGYYPDAVYIDLSLENNNQEKIEELFLDNPTSLLLLDEISYLEGYENTAQLIYNMSSGEHNRKFKVIMTGSSASHVVKLRSTKLGGRARLFRLPTITFVEYLYFTDRIPAYSDYSKVTDKDFADYLLLKDFDSNLSVQFDANYFSAFYDENEIGNRKSYLSHSITNLGQNDLKNMVRLIAYKLSEACAFEKMMMPKVGGQEHDSLYNLGIKVKMSKIDLSDAFISTSASEAVGISASDKGRILCFLLYSGLANIEYERLDSASPVMDVGEVLSVCKNCSNDHELVKLFESVSICLLSPLFYTRIGEDIMNKMNISVESLCKGMLLGKMLEIYVRGALSMYSSNTVLTSQKLNFPNLGEVDICDFDNRIMCEATVGKKALDKINVNKYYKDIPYVRICTTQQHSDTINGFHRIPYAKLCCMIDTGDILKLAPTTIFTNLGSSQIDVDGFHKFD